MDINLTNHLAIVTGGAGQLGRVISHTLAACGADVIVHYHNSQAKAHALSQSFQAMGRASIAVQADVTDAASVDGMKAQILAEFGRLPDIIVNNAVAQYTWTTVMDQPLEDYESQFRSCTLQNVIMAKAFVPTMVEQKWGRVIAINTECAMQNFPNQSAYVSGKRGMDGVLRVLAKEIGQHQITVNQVAPGWMISDGSPDGDSAGELAYKAAVPLRHRGKDQDVANLVAFLASDLASFISGQYISVSGGNVMPAI